MERSPAEENQFKQTQAEVLTREVDTNEYIPELRQLKTDVKSVTGAINYLNGQYQTAVLNANTAQRVAYDAKAVVEAFMANPPKDGKSAFEIANSLRPAGAKYKDEMEWINSLEEIKDETMRSTLDNLRIFLEVKTLEVTIEPQDWHHRGDKDGGFTYIIQDDVIKKNQNVELAECLAENAALYDILAQATCDSIADGEMTIRIPECDEPNSPVVLGFNLKEYVIERDDKA